MWKLQTRKECDAAAQRLFGFKPPKRKGESPVPYDASEYRLRFGIDIERCIGFFAEVDNVDSPEAPMTPATARLPIKPILAIRENGGKFEIRGLEMTTGFFNKQKTKAWIPIAEFEEMIGDVFFEKLLEEINQNVTVSLKHLDLDGLTEEEQAVFDKVKDGAEFEDMSKGELTIISQIMRRLRSPEEE